MTYLKQSNPETVDILTIGHSGQGRPIQVIRLKQDGDAANKKAIFIDAGIVLK